MGIINGVETTLHGTLFVFKLTPVHLHLCCVKNILKTTKSLVLLLEKGGKVVGFAQYIFLSRQYE